MHFRAPRYPLYIRILLPIAITLLLGLHVVALHSGYTWRGNTHPDFFVEWTASRVALRGGNPYSDETTLRIQMGSKGHLVSSEEDQLAFVSPLYRVLLSAPLAFMPYPWATAIWQTAMQFSLLAGVLLFIRSLGWYPSRTEFVLLILLSILPYPLFGGLMLGQMATGVLAMLLVGFWALQRHWNVLAGACLACATVKPQLAVLAVPGLLLWSVAQRRWQVLISFTLCFTLLTCAAFLIYPNWLGEFLRAVQRYPSYKPAETGASFLLSDCCGGLWPWVLEVTALVGLMVSWWAAWRRKEPCWFEGAFALTLAMTAFVPPQTSPVDRMMLLPAVLLLMRDVGTQVARLMLTIATIVGTWLAYALLYESNYGLSMGLPPAIVLILMVGWYLAERHRHGRKTELAHP